MMQYKYNDSVLTEIPNPKGAFVSLTNQDGKKWTLPVCHCSTGLEIYEPSGIKGHLLKLGFPLLCKTGCHKLGRCSPCNVYLGKPLKELLDSCEEYMLPKETAQQIIGEVLNAVKEWRALATRLGLAKSEQERFVAVFERVNTIL